MAAVALEPRSAASLTRKGVLDSKAYGAGDDAHARRTELAALIREKAQSVVLSVIEVEEIDRRVWCHELNVLEREHAVRMIDASPPAKRIICDGARMFQQLRARYPQLEARDKAESVHVAVAAASVVAKARRDELYREIAARYEPEFGPIAGGGYENAATHNFVRAYVARYGGLPREARRSWGSWAACDYLPAPPARPLPLFE
jgi:ribonuclease HII